MLTLKNQPDTTAVAPGLSQVLHLNLFLKQVGTNRLLSFAASVRQV